MQRLTFRAMGCQMLAVLDDTSAQAARLLAQVPGWFEGWEQTLSRFRQDSELSQLNRNAGRQTPVSAVLWEVVQAALHAARQSQGLVVPTLLHALEAAGYDRSFEALGADLSRGTARRAPTPPPASPPPDTGDWRAIRCDSRTRCITLPAGMRLDLGGIAKGWAADQAVGRLSAYGPALVDAGGDIAISGPRADGQPWPIGVASPATWAAAPPPPERGRKGFSPEEPSSVVCRLSSDHQSLLGLLMLPRAGRPSSCGVATSGRDVRRWQRNGVWQHHILDPRSGQPAITDVISATVVAPTALEAEIAAKVALILGSRDGLAWLEARPPLAGLLVLEDGRVIPSRRLDDVFLEESCDICRLEEAECHSQG
mgnify:FL=1